MAKNKTREEKIEEIKNRKSNFAKRLFEQRKAAQERLNKYKSTVLDTGIEPKADLDLDDPIPYLPSQKAYEEAESFKKLFNVKGKVEKVEQPDGMERDPGDGTSGLDADEIQNEQADPPEGSKAPKEYVLEFYKELKEEGINSKNATLLVLSAVIGEAVGALNRRNRV